MNYALANVFTSGAAITRSWRPSQVLKPICDDVHHHIDGQVTATESVMEETVAVL